MNASHNDATTEIFRSHDGDVNVQILERSSMFYIKFAFAIRTSIRSIVSTSVEHTTSVWVQASLRE